MAMLADPRRKQKLSFDPRNTNWSNDESKFGHKLMEKMGWSKGKGLGVKEDGNTEHVSVSLKNDTRGVGCSKSHVDNWIAHQDDFNALLANLGQDHNSNGNFDETPDKVLSLEQKSRTSKGRVHYQKFTKGKDLSLKSATDLDCVFGKRKSQSGTSTPQAQLEHNLDDEEQSARFNTVTSTDSVHDYFKKKMAEKMNKLKGNVESGSDNVELDRDNTEFETATNSIDSNENDANYKEIKKSKKKSKKRKRDSEEIKEINYEIDSLDSRTEGIDIVEEIVPKKKSKKKKTDYEHENIDMNDTSQCKNMNQKKEKVSKKKSKKKKRNFEMNDTVEGTEEVGIDFNDRIVENVEDTEKHIGEAKSKKKKKRKGEMKESVDLKPKKRVSFLIEAEDGDESEIKESVSTKPKKRVSFLIGAEGSDESNAVETGGVKHEKDNVCLTPGITGIACNKEIEAVSIELQETTGIKSEPCRSNTGLADKDLCEISETVSKHEDIQKQTKVEPHDGSKDVIDKNLHMGTISANKKTGDNGHIHRSENASMSSETAKVPAVKQNGEAFRGANMKHLHGYAGLQITPDYVHSRLSKLRE